MTLLEGYTLQQIYHISFKSFTFSHPMRSLVRKGPSSWYSDMQLRSLCAKRLYATSIGLNLPVLLQQC